MKESWAIAGTLEYAQISYLMKSLYLFNYLCFLDIIRSNFLHLHHPTHTISRFPIYLEGDSMSTTMYMKTYVGCGKIIV